MRLRLLTLCGLLLGVLILLAATLTAPTAALAGFRAAEQQALQQDKGVASNSQQPCANPQLRVDAPERVLLDSETETITIRVTNTDTVECDLTVSLVAPAFTLQPADNQQLVRLTPTTSANLRWTVRPKGTGTATLAVTTGNASQQVGISVVSGNGFVPPERATLNYVGILLGALLALGSLLLWSLALSRRVGATSTPASTPTPTPTSTPATGPASSETAGSM
jgi:hypothetical protein